MSKQQDQSSPQSSYSNLGSEEAPERGPARETNRPSQRHQTPQSLFYFNPRQISSSQKPKKGMPKFPRAQQRYSEAALDKDFSIEDLGIDIQSLRSDKSISVIKIKEFDSSLEDKEKLSQEQKLVPPNNQNIKILSKILSKIGQHINSHQKRISSLEATPISIQTDKSMPIQRQQQPEVQSIIDSIPMIRFLIEMKKQAKTQDSCDDFHQLIKEIVFKMYQKPAIKDYIKRTILTFVERGSFWPSNPEEHPLSHELEERYAKFQIALVKNKHTDRMLSSTQLKQYQEQQPSLYTEINQKISGTKLPIKKIVENLTGTFISLTVLLRKKYHNMESQQLIKLLFMQYSSFEKQFGISYDFIKAEQDKTTFQTNVNLCLAMSLLKISLTQVSNDLKKSWNNFSLTPIKNNLVLMDHQEKMRITKQILLHAPLIELQRAFQSHQDYGGSKKSQLYTYNSQYLFDPKSNFSKLNKKFETKDPEFFLYYFFDFVEFIRKILKVGFQLVVQKENLGVHEGKFAYKTTKELTVYKNRAQLLKVDKVVANKIEQILAQQKKELKDKDIGLALRGMFPYVCGKNTEYYAKKRQYFCQIQEKMFFALDLLRQFQKAASLQKYKSVFAEFRDENNNPIDFFLCETEKQIHELYNKTRQNFKKLTGIKRSQIAQLKKQQRGLLQEVLDMRCSTMLFGLYFKLVKEACFDKIQQFKIFSSLTSNRPSTVNRVYKCFIKPEGLDPQTHLQQTLKRLQCLKRQSTIFNGIVGVKQYWNEEILVQSWIYEDLNEPLFTKMDAYPHNLAIVAWKRMLLSHYQTNKKSSKPLDQIDKRIAAQMTTSITKQFVRTICIIIQNATSEEIDLPVLLLRHFLMTVQRNQKYNLIGIIPKLHLIPALLSLLSINNDPKVPTEYNMLNHVISSYCLPTALRNELIRNIFFASLWRSDNDEVTFLRQVLIYFEYAVTHNFQQPQQLVQYVTDYLFGRKPRSLNNSHNQNCLDNGALVDDYQALTIAQLIDWMMPVLLKDTKQREVAPYYIDMYQILQQLYKQSHIGVLPNHGQNRPRITRGSRWIEAPQLVTRRLHGHKTVTLHHNHYRIPHIHAKQDSPVRQAYSSLLKMIYHNMKYLYEERVNNPNCKNTFINSVVSVMPKVENQHPEKIHEDFVFITYHQDHRLHRVRDYKHQQKGPFYHSDPQLLMVEDDYKNNLFSRQIPEQQLNFTKHLLVMPKDARKIALQLLPLSLPSLDFVSDKQISVNTLSGGVNWTMQQFRNCIPGKVGQYRDDISIIPVFNELSGCILYPIVPNQQLRRMNIEGYSGYVNRILQGSKINLKVKQDNNQFRNYYAETSYSAFCEERYHHFFMSDKKQQDIRYRQKYDLGQVALIIVQLHTPIYSQKCYMRYRAAVQNYKKYISIAVFDSEQERQGAVCDFKQQLYKMVADTRFSYLNQDQAEHFRRILVRQLAVEVEKRLSYDEMIEQLRNHVPTLVE